MPTSDSTAMVGSASYCHADTLVIFSQAQSVSATGSRPFDEDADGLVAAEGYVVLLIKTLEKALADGDRIRAVIRGIGISSVIQPESHEAGAVPLVLMIHDAAYGSMLAAIKQIAALDCIKAEPVHFHVETFS